jgi:chromosomal replication initiation ATPase DnaA
MSAEIARLESEIARLEKTLALYRKRDELEQSLAVYCEKTENCFARLLRTVCREFNLTEQAIRSTIRPRHICEPRMMAMSLTYELAPELCGHRVSLSEVGRFYQRDHGTVLNAIRTVHNLSSVNPEFAARLETLRSVIRSEQKK